MGGAQQAVQLLFKHCADSRLCCDLPIVVGMDCNLASPEHLCMVYQVLFH